MKKTDVVKAIMLTPLLIAGAMAVMMISYIFIPLIVVIFVFAISKALVDIDKKP